MSSPSSTLATRVLLLGLLSSGCVSHRFRVRGDAPAAPPEPIDVVVVAKFATSHIESQLWAPLGLPAPDARTKRTRRQLERGAEERLQAALEEWAPDDWRLRVVLPPDDQLIGDCDYKLQLEPRDGRFGANGLMFPLTVAIGLPSLYTGYTVPVPTPSISSAPIDGWTIRRCTRSEEVVDEGKLQVRNPGMYQWYTDYRFWRVVFDTDPFAAMARDYTQEEAVRARQAWAGERASVVQERRQAMEDRWIGRSAMGPVRSPVHPKSLRVPHSTLGVQFRRKKIPRTDGTGRRPALEVVQANSGCRPSGLVAGDVVLKLNDRGMSSWPDLALVMADRLPGDVVHAVVLRGGRRVEVDVPVQVTPGSMTTNMYGMGAACAAPAPGVYAASAVVQPQASPGPRTLLAPSATPSGRYASPYLANGQLAPWAVAAPAAGVGGALAGAGAQQLTEAVASQALGSVPGGEYLAKFAGKAAKKAAENKVQQAGAQLLQADFRFATPCELAVHLHVEHSGKPNFQTALGAVFQKYPELTSQYQACINQAPAAPAPSAAGSSDSSEGSDLAGQIQKLQQLHEAGVLTDEEFSAAKRKLLEGGAP